MTNLEHENAGLNANGRNYVLESLRPEVGQLPDLGDEPEVLEAEHTGGSVLGALEAALRRRFQQEVQRTSDA